MGLAADKDKPLTPAQKLNQVKATLTLIEGNARRATPGPWHISHSHVIKMDKRGGKDLTYDIASRPFDRKDCVYGVNPYASPTPADDMRHISTCDPRRMLKLVEYVRELLEIKS